MTTGNAGAAATRGAGTEERFIEATLELIAEQGGSIGVNLRGVSRRVGCAHTNVYNYFDSYGDLLWAAFARALRIYGGAITRGLDVTMSADTYLERAITNLAGFPADHPGLYRFVGSDPLDLDDIPADIMDTVVAMKRWFAATVRAAAGPSADPAEALVAAEIVLAYIDGETLNLINGRAIPGEDLQDRVVANAERLVSLLIRGRGRGRGRSDPPDPALIFGA